jgi:DNA sulfur modification protein DndB
MPGTKARLGDTEYYQVTMTAADLVKVAQTAKGTEEWESGNIEDRIQREPDLKRIMTDIVPYLGKAADRFFGSLILLFNGSDLRFLSVKELSPNLSNPFITKKQMEMVGFVITEGARFIVLDGQHRYLALEKIIAEANGELGQELPFAKDLKNDEVSVIFIPYESKEKTRRIFNKVNRYAKTTSRSDNIITSEDDPFAIVARWLLNDDAPLGMKIDGREGIVDWKSNTLSTRSNKLTTLSAVYETARLILGNAFSDKIDDKQRPGEDTLQEYFEVAARFWQMVLDGIEPYREATENPSVIHTMRADDQPHSLLFKPASQIAFFKALTLLKDLGLTLEEALERANEVDWCMQSPIWRDVIVRASGSIDPKAEARDKAARLIVYLIASEKMTEEQIDQLTRDYNTWRGYDFEHAERNEPGRAVEELPQPVSSLAA